MKVWQLALVALVVLFLLLNGGSAFAGSSSAPAPAPLPPGVTPGTSIPTLQRAAALVAQTGKPVAVPGGRYVPSLVGPIFLPD